MRTSHEAPWRRRMSLSTLQENVAFSGEDLVLGCGTILLKPAVGTTKSVMLRSDAARDRMVALLAVAGRGRLAKAPLLQLDAALDEWRRGDSALAAIRLAFARLPRVLDREEAHTLFLAETALDAGLSAHELLRELGYVGCLNAGDMFEMKAGGWGWELNAETAPLSGNSKAKSKIRMRLWVRKGVIAKYTTVFQIPLQQ